MSEQQEEWTDWIEHDGKGCPVSAGQYVGVEARNIKGEPVYAEDFVDDEVIHWWNRNDAAAHPVARITRYRIRKPRALSQLRQLVENLPERETTDA